MYIGDIASLTFLPITYEQYFNSYIISFHYLSRALNANNFTGKIPPSLGKLVNLTWLDLADNQLDGPLPISSKDGWGLDQLRKAKHLSVSFVPVFY